MKRWLARVNASPVAIRAVRLILFALPLYLQG
jgi:hypothetical protein